MCHLIGRAGMARRWIRADLAAERPSLRAGFKTSADLHKKYKSNQSTILGP